MDARSLFATEQPTCFSEGKVSYTCWDFDGFKTWQQLGHDVRVVRSVETRTIRRQDTGQLETLKSDWVWTTNLPPRKAGTRSVLCFGHHRWDIEERGFNELVNGWQADHVYRHDLNAMLAFLLLLFVLPHLPYHDRQ